MKLRTIDKVIIHCSDSDVPAHDDISVIRKWHLARGFKDVGYHFVICKKAHYEIQRGRSIDEEGAHCKYYNEGSIGICLTGRKEFAQGQFRQCKFLLMQLSLILGKNFLQWTGKEDFSTMFPHHFFNKQKTCPNFDINLIINADLAQTDNGS